MAKIDEEKVYIVADEMYRDTFEEKVNELLLKGYLPLGGVSTYVDKDGYVHYCQALLKPSSIQSKKNLMGVGS